MPHLENCISDRSVASDSDGFTRRCSRSRIQIPHIGCVRDAYKVLGYAGLAMGIVLIMILANFHSLSIWSLTVVVSIGVVSSYVLAIGTKMILGIERLVCYHHHIAVGGATALASLIMGEEAARYLDVVAMGLGCILAVGRLGCLLVGCCYGRPGRWGVCYGEEHAAAGFPAHLVGVRLFPIQLVESLWVFGIVAVGSVLLVRGAAPGEALAWYVVSYGLGRFCFEFARGDDARPYLLGFSEAQWTSLTLMGGVVAGEWSGVLPLHSWYVMTTAGIAFVMMIIALRRCLRRVPKHRLLHPRHVREIAEAIDQLSAPNIATADHLGKLRIARTSLGIRLSTGMVEGPGGPIRHYTISCADGPINKATVDLLSRLILTLRPASVSGRIASPSGDLFHLIVSPLRAVEPFTPLR